MFVSGGSHGGFLTAHLSASRPDLFAAAAIRNPVINLNSMRHVTDIPDWVEYQSTGVLEQFDFGFTTDEEKLNTFHQMSPISKVAAVKSPTLMMIGWKDLRVPPPQGQEWVRALRKNGVECN